MKKTVYLFFFIMSFPASVIAQSTAFPESWAGNWKGELQWYKMGQPQPQKVNMELRVHAGDSAHKFTWQIIYGSETKDNRPYTLIAKDEAKVHWVIDEKNGIVLDQYWIGDKLCGVFTVQNSTIINSYRIENDKLIAEFYSFGAKPVASTGKGTEDSPAVDSYKVGSYQKAILQRTE